LDWLASRVDAEYFQKIGDAIITGADKALVASAWHRC
jgi:hypothetical protein